MNGSKIFLNSTSLSFFFREDKEHAYHWNREIESVHQLEGIISILPPQQPKRVALRMTRKILLVRPWLSILGQGRKDVQGIPPTNYFYICADNSHSPVAWNHGQTQYALKTTPYTYIETKLFHEQNMSADILQHSMRSITSNNLDSLPLTSPNILSGARALLMSVQDPSE